MQSNLSLRISALAIALLSAGLVQAAVSPEQAARLNSDLTPLGAERAGNKDGSIPEWTGGYTTAPAGYKNGDKRADPFAADKPPYSVCASKTAHHPDNLAQGPQT